MIFRKNILDIRKEYKDLKIKNEDLEMYDEVDKIREKSEKDNEKIGEKRDKQEKNITDYKEKYKKAEARLDDLKKEHPILTMVAKIPLIGRFGKVAKEYRRIKAKMKRAKIKGKVAEKAYKNLDEIYSKKVEEIKKKKRYLRRCEKSIRRLYKVDKDNIKIARLWKENKTTLENIYGKSSLEYMKKYVAQVKEGEKDIELPEGFVSAKELAKKIEKDVKNRQKCKKEDITQIVNREQEEKENKKENKERENLNQKEQKNKENIFARKGLEIKRDYVGYKEEINGTKIKLTPVETLNYIGFITAHEESLENHSSEEILNAIKNDKKCDFVDRGWDVLHDMIEDLKDEKHPVDVKKLTESEKVVYSIAKKYIKKEENAKTEKENGKEEKEVAI